MEATIAIEPNGFLEYLELQGGKPDLVTKSELIAQVRAAGYRVSDRQLTFYVSEELIPRSVRVGSRAGAYPKIVVRLLTWILRSRDRGLPIEVLKELLPVWKYLIRAGIVDKTLSLAELEYIARQHVNSFEGSLALPQVVADVLGGICGKCRGSMEVVFKDGERRLLGAEDVTVGFAIARFMPDDDGSDTEAHEPEPRWFGSTRISLAANSHPSTDPTTVILGLKPNVALPPDPYQGDDTPDERREKGTHAHTH